MHFIVDRMQGLYIKQTLPDAWLVGDNNDTVTGTVEAGDCFQASFDRYPLLRRFYTAVGSLINYAISAKDDEFHIMIG